MGTSRSTRPKKGRPDSARRTLFGRNPIKERSGESRRYTRSHRRRSASRRGFISLLLKSAALGVLLGTAIIFAELAGNQIQATVASVVRDLEAVIPEPVVETEVRVTPPPQTLGLAPILDFLPQATREAALVVSGRLPAHMVAATERPRVEVFLNGFPVAAPALDEEGRFTATVGLTSGPNVIFAATVRGEDRAESPARSVTLDTTPPPLVVARPDPNQTSEDPLIVVSGYTEIGASVMVNEAVAAVSTEGAFTMTFQAPSGPFEIVVIARDAAGNETKRQLTVFVLDSATPMLGVRVILDKEAVLPGAEVTATIVVTSLDVPVPNVPMSVSLGLTPISSGRTDSEGRLVVTFRAPPTEGIVQVIAITSGAGIDGRGAAALNVTRALSGAP